MPAPGEQHSTIVNPFEEVKPRVSEYTAQEIATLQSRLEKQLGPEYLSSRAGPSGQKVHYIAAEKCIALANDVFGFNGWSSAIKEIQVDFVDENPQTLKISLGLSVIVRVSLRDGTFHEDIGYGHIENCKGKAAAFEKAKKEGTTDALKRALRSFGNVLGNCIYDKAYLQKVTKMKVEPSKFDEGGLHRHSDFAKKEVKAPEVKAPEVKSDPANTSALSAMDSFEDLLGEFDEVDFNVMEEGHPDEVVLSTSEKSQAPQNNGRPNGQNVQAPMQPPSRPLARSQSAGNPPRHPQTPNQPPSRLSHPQNAAQQNGPRPPQPQLNQSRPQNFQNGSNAGQGSNSGSGSSGLSHQTPPQAHHNTGQNAAANGAAAESVGFFSARAVSQIVRDTGEKEEARLPTAPQLGQVFNPHAESPSIPKTPGIDHTKSKPLTRTGKHVPPVERSEDEDVSTSAAGVASGARGNGPPSGPPQSVNSMGARGPGQLSAQPPQQPRPNMMNPQIQQARRIGAPGGPGSPLANRGQYRPPTMKRPIDANGGGPGRPALTEVTANGTVNTTPGGAGVGGDVKRQKMG